MDKRRCSAQDDEVVNNAALRQFELGEGDQLSRLTYKMRGSGLIDLIHTEVPKALEGRGLANRLAAAALDYAERQSLRVIPTCPFVATYIRRHPELAKLTHRSDE